MRLFLLVTLFFHCFTLGQTSKTVIVDQLTKSPIPFMVITTESDVLTTDENGEIAKEKLKDIPFKIVSETYKSKIFAAGFDADTIFMEQESKLLESATVTENKNVGASYQLGYHNEMTKVFPVYGYLMGNQNVLVTHIPGDGKKVVIEKLFIKLEKIQKDSMYTCLLYAVDEKQKPGELIFSYSLRGEYLKKKDPIDISNLEIAVPKEGVFIGVKSSEVHVRMLRKKFEVEQTYSLFEGTELGAYNWRAVQDANFKYYVTPPFGLQVRLK